MKRFIRVVYEASSKLDLDGLKKHLDKHVDNEETGNFANYMNCEIRNIGYNLTDDNELCGIEIDIKGPTYKCIETCIRYIKENISTDGIKVGKQDFKAKGDIIF